jgi:hypothetical protein
MDENEKSHENEKDEKGVNYIDLPEGNDDEFADLPDDERAIIADTSEEAPKVYKGQGPLDSPVTERDYNNGSQIYSSDTTLDEPVDDYRPPSTPSPTANTRPLIDKKEEKYQAELGKNDAHRYAQETLGEKPAGTAPDNPAVATMGAKERKENLAMTIDNVIMGYEKLKFFLGNIFTIGEKTIIKRQSQGKAPAGWAILHDKGSNQTLTLVDFINKTNDYIHKACRVSDDFKTSIKPMLMAEFDKRGWIASSQQNIFFMVGQDLLMMGQQLMSLKMNMNQVLKRADDEFEKMKVDGMITDRELYNMNLVQPVNQTQQKAHVEYVHPQQQAAQPKPNAEKPAEKVVVEKKVEKKVEPEFEIPE